MDITKDMTFDAWWEIYPKKQGKELARKKWEKLTDHDKWNCYNGTLYHKQENPQWKKPQYIPMPTTWLNQKRWEDEIVRPKSDADQVIENQDNGLVAGVWSALTQMYGQTFINKFGTEPNQVWIKALSNLPQSRIKRGLHRLAREHHEHPPSLPKFLECCAPTFGEQTNAPALPPRSVSDRATALHHLDEIKQLLKVDNGISE